MSQDLLEYPKLVERAMRGVVRDALNSVSATGLPGMHHFYITFRTGDDGVEIGDMLRAQYPEEMTIVLEHQFWDLDVTEDRFAVTLSFGGKQERLVIPFASVTAFVDPSVKFGLQFGAEEGTLVGSPRAEGDETPEIPAGEEPQPETGEDDAAPPTESDDGTVVALDNFRKK